MPQIQANSTTIEYERTGSGEPVLLIMGLGAQLTSWPEELVGGLVDQGFEVIRFDNRDIGLSSECSGTPPSPVRAFLGKVVGRPAASGYRIEDMAADAAGLLDALGIASVHVVGASMGGMIAQALAIGHGHRVRSLTSIMSNPGDRSGSPSAKVLAAFVRRDVPTRETAVEQSVATFRLISGPLFDEAEHRTLAQREVARSFRPEGQARQLAAIMASPDRTPGLRQLSQPTLVVHGLADPLVRPSGGIATARAVPGSRLLMFPDMGHDLPPARIPEIIDAIAGITRRAPVPIEQR